MIIHASIKTESNNKHFPENRYWEFNPNSVYIGSIELDVKALIQFNKFISITLRSW